MKAIFQKLFQVFGKDPGTGKVNFPKGIRKSGARDRRGFRDYREGKDHHDRWVELLSPQSVVGAARELAPRWDACGPERLPRAVEIWRSQRRAALMRRIRRERLSLNL